MEKIKKIFKDCYILWFTAIICVFHILLGLLRYFLDVQKYQSLDYCLVLIALAGWIIHMIVYRVKPRPGKSFIILVFIFLWYLLSCRVMTDTYNRDWFFYNKEPLYDTLLLSGLVFPIGIYFGRKGWDPFVRALIHIFVLSWTCFMAFVLVRVFQNRIITTPSGGQIGMNSHIALCLNTHYNTTGVIELVMLFIIMFFICTSRSRVLKIAYALALLVHLAALVLSNSRTSFVASVIFFSAVVFSMIYNAPWNITFRKRLLIGVTAAAITMVLLFGFRELVFSIHENVTHLKALLKGTSEVSSSARDMTSMRTMNIRFRIWESSLKAMTANEYRALFGVTPVSVVSAITEASGGEFTNYYTHNQFLEIGLSLGFPGMILFILFVILLAKNSYRISIKHNEGLQAWIAVSIVVTLLVANLTEATLMFYRFLSSYPFFFFSGWICGTAAQQAESDEPHKKIRNKK